MRRPECRLRMTPLPKRGRFRSLTVGGWALNEEANLPAYVARVGDFLTKFADDYEVIVIDDGSTDRTWDMGLELSRSRPWLRMVKNDRNRGSGYNYKRALSLATKDYVLCQTVDWAYDIELLGEALPLLATYDVLQGVRPSNASLPDLLHGRSDTLKKAVISYTNYLLVRALFGMPVRDFQNVSVFPRPLIQSIALESESAFTNPECMLKAWWLGASFKEVPVPFIKRTAGQAKGTRLKTVVRSMRDVFAWWLRWIVLGKRHFVRRGTVTPWETPEPDLALAV